MFGTIRKHSTTLWVVLIAVIIVSFVIFFTPDVGRQSGRSGPIGTINERPVAYQEYEQAYRETLLRYLFAFGRFPASDAEAEQRGINMRNETVQRMILKEKVRELGIVPGEDAVAAYIARAREFRSEQDGGFSREMYENFVARALPQARPPLSEADYLRYVRAELGLQHLQDLFGASGTLVTQAEAEEVFRRENEQFLTEIVVFDPANYADKVNMAQTNLMQFYSNRLANFRIPDRLVVEFVKFDFSNHLAEATAELAKITNLTALIDDAYTRADPKQFLGTNNLPLPPEEAKAKMREAELNRAAQLAARKAANAFATELYDRQEKEPKKAGHLAALAQAKGLALTESLPFSRFDNAHGLEVMENFAQQAFAIDEEEPFKGPIPGTDAYFVIAVKRRLPSEIPPLENILQRVMDEYRAEQAVTLAREAGTAFAAKARSAVAMGRTFSQAATDAKVTVKPLPAFSNSSQNIEGLDRSLSASELQLQAQALPVGGVSDYRGGPGSGFVLHVKGRQPATADDLAKGLPAFTERLRLMRRSQAFQEWARQHISTTRVTGELAPTVGR
jgi:peptidyl-prolyl cis-trans isomerase D